MFGLGTTELLVILFIVILVFGVGKLPKLGSSLGEGIQNFRKSVRGDDEEEDDSQVRNMNEKKHHELPPAKEVSLKKQVEQVEEKEKV